MNERTVDPEDPNRSVIGKGTTSTWAIIDPDDDRIVDMIVADAEFVAHYKKVIADPNTSTPGLTTQHQFREVTNMDPKPRCGDFWTDRSAWAKQGKDEVGPPRPR